MPDIFTKDPDEVLDYIRDWAPDFALNAPGDTIATSTWTPEPGITVISSSHTTTKATVWISGGTEGANYGVRNRITTVGGRTFDKTLYFWIRAK